MMVFMKTNTRRKSQLRSATTAEAMELHDFEQLANEQGVQLEHATVPGFLRRIPHKWHLEEITRYGDKVGRAAEAMQLAYMTSIDRSLGVIRVFPLPLLQRVYEIMAPSFGWPRAAEAELIEDGKRAQRETLRKIERADHALGEVTEQSDNVEALTAFRAVRSVLQGEAAKLREQIAEPAAS